jgi:SAM-dependent methyltransferase
MLVEVPPRVEFSYSGKMTLLLFARPRWFRRNDTHTRWNPDVTRRVSSCLPLPESWLTRLLRLRIAGKSPANAFLRFNRRLFSLLPSRIGRLAPVRAYGDCVHAFARIQGVRELHFSTYFLRNRPELELIRRLVERKGHGDTLRVAVLGCSFGAEAYSIAWRIRSARPDLKLVLNAVDISPHAVEFARRGVYSLTGSEPTAPWIFERMTAADKEEFFYTDGQVATVRPWIKEGITWRVGDVGEPEIVDALGPQDIVVASNFLCHMAPSLAERCLRNIARLVTADGYLFVSGIDLEVRTKVARDLGWKPLQELLEEIHDGDPVPRIRWPWHYGGLEPLDKKRRDWRTRYAAAFHIVPKATEPTMQPENERGAAISRH